MINKIKTDIEQITHLTFANLKARYRNTFAGLIWVSLNPIILYGVQSFVFKHFLKVEIPKYDLFLLSGLLPWIFITQGLEICIPLLLGSSDIIKSFKVPPFYFIAAQLLDNFINFLFAFIVVAIPIILINQNYSYGLLFIPLALIPLFLGTLSLAWFFSFLNVFYRDVKYIVNFGIGVMFYLTPIFYPIEFAPKQYHWIFNLNPLYPLINPFRICLYQFSLSKFILHFFIGMGWVSLFALCSYFITKKMRNEFYLVI